MKNQIICICLASLAAETPQAVISSGKVTAKLYLPEAQDGYYNNAGFGYEEAKPGRSLVKIGIGASRKPDTPRFGQFSTYN